MSEATGGVHLQPFLYLFVKTVSGAGAKEGEKSNIHLFNGTPPPSKIKALDLIFPSPSRIPPENCGFVSPKPLPNFGGHIVLSKHGAGYLFVLTKQYCTDKKQCIHSSF